VGDCGSLDQIHSGAAAVEWWEWGDSGLCLQEFCSGLGQSPNGVRKRALLKKGGGSSWTEHMPGNKVKNWSIGQWELM